jgi:transcriptional regulator with XRE-family HTH domain
MAVIDLGELLTLLSQDLALSDSDLLGALEVDARTLDRWRNNETYPQRDARMRLDRLHKFDLQLRETFSDEEAMRAWMTTDNRYLGLLQPREVARAGRLDRLEAALEALNSGAFV